MKKPTKLERSRISFGHMAMRPNQTHTPKTGKCASKKRERRMAKEFIRQEA